MNSGASGQGDGQHGSREKPDIADAPTLHWDAYDFVLIGHSEAVHGHEPAGWVLEYAGKARKSMDLLIRAHAAWAEEAARSRGHSCRASS